MTNKWVILLIVGFSGSALAVRGPDLPPGPYCGIDNRCCRDRQDDCSHRLLDTICYCDEFCGRVGADHDDCCPDYEEVCLGIVPTTEPPQQLLEPCRYNGRVYLPYEKRVDNCNSCECLVNPVNNETYWGGNCNQTCLVSDDVLYGVNHARLGWRAYNYTQFYGRTLKEGLTYKLGTLPLTLSTLNMGPITYGARDLPSSYDSRRERGNYIHPIIDQGWCGSDWAVTVAAVASDRLAIQSKGAENLVLSPQTLLSCNKEDQLGCEGGNIDVAWNFAGDHGLVDEECFPYKATVTNCPFKWRGNLRSDGCRTPSSGRVARYRVSPPARLMHERDIMYDIMQSGPVHAVLSVYQDFFHYRDGIYRRSQYGDHRLRGLHSVRIIGWGEEGGVKYWIVANSWGTEWGENGYFRIVRGSNESGIESFVTNVLSEVREAYERK